MHMHMHRNRETASHCEPLTICLPIFSTTESGAEFTYSPLFLFWRVSWDATVHLFCCCILRSVWKAYLGEYRERGEKTGAVANAVDRYTIVQSELEDNRFRFCLTMRVLKCSEQSVPQADPTKQNTPFPPTEVKEQTKVTQNRNSLW